MPTPQRGHASIEIAAPPERVYDLIADVTRMGEWSPECYRCDWLDGATAAVAGTGFRGYNRRGRHRWERTAVTTSEIDEAVRLYVDDQRSIRAIAAVLGKSKGSVWKALHERSIAMRPAH